MNLSYYSLTYSLNYISTSHPVNKKQNKTKAIDGPGKIHVCISVEEKEEDKRELLIHHQRYFLSEYLYGDNMKSKKGHFLCSRPPVLFCLYKKTGKWITVKVLPPTLD